MGSKLCSNKILQFLTVVLANAGGTGSSYVAFVKGEGKGSLFVQCLL